MWGLSTPPPPGPSAAMVSAPPPHLGAIMRSGRISPCLGVKAPMSVPHGTDVHYTASTSATVHFHFLLTPKFSLLLLSAVEPRKHFPSYISMATYKQAFTLSKTEVKHALPPGSVQLFGTLSSLFAVSRTDYWHSDRGLEVDGRGDQVWLFPKPSSDPADPLV